MNKLTIILMLLLAGSVMAEAPVNDTLRGSTDIYDTYWNNAATTIEYYTADSVSFHAEKEDGVPFTVYWQKVQYDVYSLPDMGYYRTNDSIILYSVLKSEKATFSTDDSLYLFALKAAWIESQVNWANRGDESAWGVAGAADTSSDCHANALSETPLDGLDAGDTVGIDITTVYDSSYFYGFYLSPYDTVQTIYLPFALGVKTSGAFYSDNHATYKPYVIAFGEYNDQGWFGPRSYWDGDTYSFTADYTWINREIISDSSVGNDSIQIDSAMCPIDFNSGTNDSLWVVLYDPTDSSLVAVSEKVNSDGTSGEKEVWFTFDPPVAMASGVDSFHVGIARSDDVGTSISIREHTDCSSTDSSFIDAGGGIPDPFSNDAYKTDQGPYIELHYTAIGGASNALPQIF